MTQEEKAKRYDEALHKAKNYYSTTDSSSDIKLIGLIFHELKESEDERIRKEMISWLKGFIGEEEGCGYTEDEIKERIAWLEKQGENISLPKFTFDDVLALQCVMETTKKVQEDKELYEQLQSLHDRLHDAYWLEKQGEQKPTDWSEDDEKILDDTIELLEKANHPNIMHSNGKPLDFTTNINLLKSLKNKIQPKAEWNEEDERLFQIVIDILDRANHLGNLSHADLIACVRKLKSLRPQNNITDEELAQAKKNAYNDALDKIEYHSGEPTFDDGWSAAIWYLKKRTAQPQSTWKPSDEHYELEEFAKIVRGNLTGISKAVQELFEAKYLQLTGNKMYGGFKD